MNLRPSLDAEDDDPILSLVNLIDVFLVLVAALLLAIGNQPINPFGRERITVIKDAGTPRMEVVIKEGAKVERFKAGEGQGEGRGVRAGVAYRMADGSMVYVPEAAATAP